MPTSEIERRTLRKVTWRLLPLLSIAYFVSGLDRTNISYAALQMNQDLHLSAEVFGLGGGLFAVTYLLVGLPSNLIIEKVGARLWIAMIMICWGLISTGMVAAVGPNSFISLRLLLGAAEAGFVPGILLYITYWFPKILQGRAIAIFLLALPISNAISALLSVPILAMDGLLGLRGWQWLFIIEGLPAVIIGVAMALLMTNRPAQAKWLTAEEKTWLQTRLDQERPRPRSATAASMSLWQITCTPYVLALALVYGGRNVGMFGVTLFLPQIVRHLGLSIKDVGLLTSLPYLLAAFGMWLWARSSDLTGERRWHLTGTVFVAAIGMAAAGLVFHSLWSLVAISFAAIGFFACSPCLYAIVPAVLGPAERASGLAIVNSLAQLGAMIGPYGIGWIRTRTGSFEDALYFVAACAAMSAIMAAWIRPLPPQHTVREVEAT
jgi:ACS family tartrate transporter-like MFS transporter